jgi:hypothetical protein
MLDKIFQVDNGGRIVTQSVSVVSDDTTVLEVIAGGVGVHGRRRSLVD